MLSGIVYRTYESASHWGYCTYMWKMTSMCIKLGEWCLGVQCVSNGICAVSGYIMQTCGINRNYVCKKLYIYIFT